MLSTINPATHADWRNKTVNGVRSARTHLCEETVLQKCYTKNGLHKLVVYYHTLKGRRGKSDYQKKILN